MKMLLPIISFTGLALVIVPAILYLAGAVDKDQMKAVMLAGTLVWFVSVPLWMGKRKA